MEKTKVALLGLGTMGSGMAKNLLKAGFPLTVYNRTPEKAEALRAAGASVAATPADAAQGAAIVLGMLSDDAASRTAWLGEHGALAAMQPDAIAIECSTLSPVWIAELNRRASARNIRLIDAPVTGSRAQAEGGQLNFLAGGDPGAIEEARPVLEAMSRKVYALGPTGSGAQLKLINNFLSGVQVASFAEALAWIERTALNREVAIDFLKSGAPGSPIFATMGERMTRRTYEVNFLLRLMDKDLRYAQAAAAAFGLQLSTAAAAESLFNQARNEGHGEQDMSAVVEVLRNRMA
ncbi:MAG: NAD(P)-dependent oxidoreductase [Acidobacteriota bacterium]